jgi:hypothetical protein
MFFKVKRDKGSFYTWNDQVYKEFMMDVLFSLEPRKYSSDSILYDEMESVTELLFLQKGRIGIGFRINKEIKFGMYQTDGCVVGTYGMVFDSRTEFVYQTFSRVEGQAIRKEKWQACIDGR